MPGRTKRRAMADISPEELLADIRAKCLDCCCGSRKLVQACTDTECRLHRHRCKEAQEQPEIFAGADLAGQIDIFSIGGFQ